MKQDYSNTFINLDFIPILLFSISIALLIVVVVVEGSLAPVIFYISMSTIGTLLIVFFSNKDEIFFKTKLFIFFFTLYLLYVLIHHYILLIITPYQLPYDFVDEEKLYMFSNFGLPYISGEKNFFDIFSVFIISELSLHVAFTSVIAYFSTLIDGTNTIIAQKLLSPFFGGLFSVVLYSTLKYQFEDRVFALNATFAYGLLSAVFFYSTPLLRDIDVALAYMIFFYVFLQKNNIINFLLLFIVSYATVYLRVESGMVLFALILVYVYFYSRDIKDKSLKFIFYIVTMLLFSFVIALMFNKIMSKIMILNEVNILRSVSEASSGSIGVLLNKLPFGISHTSKVLFGQMLPFPFLKEITMPAYAISGIFWPFVFAMMLYSMMRKNIRIFIGMKIKYLVIVAIAILFLMSSEPMPRRMMSVYPIIYIASLYAFPILKNNMKKIIFYYLFSMFSLNILYYMIKI